MDYQTWSENQETATVTVNEHDLEVAYYDDGDGEPVLFCHGIPTSSFLWRDVAPPLLDEYRVIVPDMIGYGNSAMHDGFNRSIRAQEEMIDGLVDELGLGALSFVGHDLGGSVGLRYAAHNSDAVENLVLSNTVCYDSWPIETIVDLGLPSTINEMSVDDAREMFEGIFRDTRYDDPSEEFVEGMRTVGLRRGDRLALAQCHRDEYEPHDRDQSERYFGPNAPVVGRRRRVSADRVRGRRRRESLTRPRRSCPRRYRDLRCLVLRDPTRQSCRKCAVTARMGSEEDSTPNR